MGDFQPDAHVNGKAGCNFTALIFNSFSATKRYNVYIMTVFSMGIGVVVI